MNAKLARSSSARQPRTGSTLANVASLQHNEIRSLPFQIMFWGQVECITFTCVTVTELMVYFWLF